MRFANIILTYGVKDKGYYTSVNHSSKTKYFDACVLIIFNFLKMIYLIDVGLNDYKSKIIDCKNGINYFGRQVCNVTKKNIPYLHLYFVEYEHGKKINCGYKKVWGKLKPTGDMSWKFFDICALGKAIKNGPISLSFLMALIYFGDEHHWEDYVNGGEEWFVQEVEKYSADFNRNWVLGKFVTRNVMPYYDLKNVRQTTYTCFLCGCDQVSEEKITKEFKYNGRTVIDEIPDED